VERLEGLLVGVLGAGGGGGPPGGPGGGGGGGGRGGRGVGRWSMGDACTLVGKLWEGTFWL